MVRLGDAYKITPETTAWELLDNVAQVPPSVEPTQVEQLLVQFTSPMFPTLQEIETVLLPSYKGEAT
eukprot:8986817-Ditylum_brightwellii.AAC.1